MLNTRDVCIPTELFIVTSATWQCMIGKKMFPTFRMPIQRHPFGNMHSSSLTCIKLLDTLKKYA